MSNVQVTPSKRRVAALPDTPQSRTQKRTRNAPAPNPPLAPFPTPSSGRRERKLAVDDESDLDSDVSVPRPVIASKPLPDHLQTLLTLHHAFNLALSMHLATNPPILPPHGYETTRLQLPNLTNIAGIKDTVERTARRRFGQSELARLAWLWAWDGNSIPKDTQDDNPFLDTPVVKEVSAMSYLLTPTRAIDPKSGRKIHVHGIGLELDVKPGETRQMDVYAGRLTGGGEAGGTLLVSKWNAESETRHAAVRSKLDKWVELNGGYEEVKEPIQLPTPTSRNSGRSKIPPIPLLPLPKLPTASAGLLFPSSPSNSPASSPSKPRPSAAGPSLGLSAPIEITSRLKEAMPGSLSSRQQSLYERIKAREEAARASTSAFLGVPSSTASSSTSSSGLDAIKRRATLSRLEGMAETIWMLFSAPSTSSTPTTPRRRRAIPLHEVTESILKSSRTPTSAAEIHTSLDLLAELCPFFIVPKKVGRQDWITMPAGFAEMPPSPGLVSPKPVGRTDSPRAMPESLKAVGRLPESPRARLPESPRALGRVVDIAGPGSPGRVSRRSGLREVRERIRRELGE